MDPITFNHRRASMPVVASNIMEMQQISYAYNPLNSTSIVNWTDIDMDMDTYVQTRTNNIFISPDLINNTEISTAVETGLGVNSNSNISFKNSANIKDAKLIKEIAAANPGIDNHAKIFSAKKGMFDVGSRPGSFVSNPDKSIIIYVDDSNVAGSVPIWRSTDGGDTWTKHDGSSTPHRYSRTGQQTYWCNNQFVCVITSNPRIYVSTDGITWTVPSNAMTIMNYSSSHTFLCVGDVCGYAGEHTDGTYRFFWSNDFFATHSATMNTTVDYNGFAGGAVRTVNNVNQNEYVVNNFTNTIKLVWTGSTVTYQAGANLPILSASTLVGVTAMARTIYYDEPAAKYYGFGGESGYPGGGYQAPVATFESTDGLNWSEVTNTNASSAKGYSAAFGYGQRLPGGQIIQFITNAVSGSKYREGYSDVFTTVGNLRVDNGFMNSQYYHLNTRLTSQPLFFQLSGSTYFGTEYNNDTGTWLTFKGTLTYGEVQDSIYIATGDGGTSTQSQSNYHISVDGSTWLPASSTIDPAFLTPINQYISSSYDFGIDRIELLAGNLTADYGLYVNESEATSQTKNYTLLSDLESSANVKYGVKSMVTGSYDDYQVALFTSTSQDNAGPGSGVTGVSAVDQQAALWQYSNKVFVSTDRFATIGESSPPTQNIAIYPSGGPFDPFAVGTIYSINKMTSSIENNGSTSIVPIGKTQVMGRGSTSRSNFLFAGQKVSNDGTTVTSSPAVFLGTVGPDSTLTFEADSGTVPFNIMEGITSAEMTFDGATFNGGNYSSVLQMAVLVMTDQNISGEAPSKAVILYRAYSDPADTSSIIYKSYVYDFAAGTVDLLNLSYTYDGTTYSNSAGEFLIMRADNEDRWLAWLLHTTNGQLSIVHDVYLVSEDLVTWTAVVNPNA